MLFDTSGIVLKLIRFKESSAVIKIYTKKFGLKSYIVNGVFSNAKSSKNKAAYFQPLSILDLVVYNKPSANINRIKEQKWKYMFTNVPFNFYKQSIVQVVNEVLVKCIKEEEDNDFLFSFLLESLVELDEKQDVKYFLIQFLIQLSVKIGFGPLNNFSDKNALFDLQQGFFVDANSSNINCLNLKESSVFSAFISGEDNNLNLNRIERKNILDVVIKYYQMQVENFGKLKSLKVLSSIFDEMI